MINRMNTLLSPTLLDGRCFFSFFPQLLRFCIVGIEPNVGCPKYLGWEPTGYFDQWFPCDEVDLRLALQRAHELYKEPWFAQVVAFSF